MFFDLGLLGMESNLSVGVRESILDARASETGFRVEPAEVYPAPRLSPRSRQGSRCGTNLFLLGSVNLDDLCLGIVERERVELPVVVLNPLFDDFRLVALSARRRSPLSNDVIRNFELERHGSQVKS
jgi:hypothetical protein